jgi:hypothetical protein
MMMGDEKREVNSPSRNSGEVTQISIVDKLISKNPEISRHINRHGPTTNWFKAPVCD